MKGAPDLEIGAGGKGMEEGIPGGRQRKTEKLKYGDTSGS